MNSRVKLNRRHFLQTSATLSGGLMLGLSLPGLSEKQAEAVLVTCCLKDSSQSTGTPRYVMQEEGMTEVPPIGIGSPGLDRRRCNEEHHITCVLLALSCKRFDSNQAITEPRQEERRSDKELVDEGEQEP